MITHCVINSRNEYGLSLVRTSSFAVIFFVAIDFSVLNCQLPYSQGGYKYIYMYTSEREKKTKKASKKFTLHGFNKE